MKFHMQGCRFRNGDLWFTLKASGDNVWCSDDIQDSKQTRVLGTAKDTQELYRMTEAASVDYQIACKLENQPSHVLSEWAWCLC